MWTFTKRTGFPDLSAADAAVSPADAVARVSRDAPGWVEASVVIGRAWLLRGGRLKRRI